MADGSTLSLGMLCKVCFNWVVALDRAMLNGDYIFAVEYHKELAHVRDFGVMYGLKADMIRNVFEWAHDRSGYHCVMTATLLAMM
jgi:hypothetical protein